jgi:hypothetical protein
VGESRRRESAGAHGRIAREEWLTIKSIVRDLELKERDWAADLREVASANPWLLGSDEQSLGPPLRESYSGPCPTKTWRKVGSIIPENAKGFAVG